MRSGNLQHIVLHKLSESPLSGYSLQKEIERASGHKPSFGSIYPILENLAKQKLVSVHQEGRKKIYTLTLAGKEQAKQSKAKYTEHIEGIIEQTRLFCDITGHSSSGSKRVRIRLVSWDHKP